MKTVTYVHPNSMKISNWTTNVANQMKTKLDWPGLTGFVAKIYQSQITCFWGRILNSICCICVTNLTFRNTDVVLWLCPKVDWVWGESDRWSLFKWRVCWPPIMSGRGLGPVALRQPQSLCICIVLSLCVVLYWIVLDECEGLGAHL